jgi:hypothetical protein
LGLVEIRGAGRPLPGQKLDEARLVVVMGCLSNHIGDVRIPLIVNARIASS